ncbi:MAG: nicotinate-nucleotide diphosphorylase (carboxylating) [Acidobacteria bacterium 13_1_40CM_3_55_6]|nr:MAG: nicotinate-nucleotide diphosphorylase (carboxylating) [Acidobacteria bacterium 13_1_40CM_3_55_6]
MNWLDEGALYSSIGLFLREDLGRGDITTQSVLMRNARARGRFVAGEKMVVAGLEAAEEVFITLDPQQQLEAFAADGEEVEADKVIARTSGFADVLLAGERTALNLLQHLSGIATITRQFVGAVEGTKAKITDTRKTTPGLRMLEKYAVMLGGGVNHRYGLDDGICIKANHAAIAGGLGVAVRSARERIGHVHKIAVEVASRNDISEAIESGANILVIGGSAAAAAKDLIDDARKLSPGITLELSGLVTLENVRAYAEAGADLIRVDALTQSVRAMDISFQIQPG